MRKRKEEQMSYTAEAGYYLLAQHKGRCIFACIMTLSCFVKKNDIVTYRLLNEVAFYILMVVAEMIQMLCVRCRSVGCKI